MVCPDSPVARSRTHRIEIEDWHPTVLAGNNGRPPHWAVKAKAIDADVALVRAHVLNKWPRCERAILRVTYIYPRKTRFDVDNLLARLKGVCDGIVAAGILPDDSSEFLRPEVQVAQEFKRKATVLELVPL